MKRKLILCYNPIDKRPIVFEVPMAPLSDPMRNRNIGRILRLYFLFIKLGVMPSSAYTVCEIPVVPGIPPVPETGLLIEPLHPDVMRLISERYLPLTDDSE